MKGSPERPAGRYNRKGEDALYLTLNEASARVAMKKYAADITFPIFLIHFQISNCSLVDLRLTANKDLKSKSVKDWSQELKQGLEPSSWQVSDYLRRNGEIGLIDPSRKSPSVWHVTLFRWNEPDAPTVSISNDHEPTPLFDI